MSTTQQWTFPNKRQSNVINTTSQLGCLRLPSGDNFSLNYLLKYTAFDCLPLPQIEKFAIYMHGNLKYLTRAILCCIHVEPSVSEL